MQIQVGWKLAHCQQSHQAQFYRAWSDHPQPKYRQLQCFFEGFSHVSATSNQQHQLQVLQLGTKGLAFLERSQSVAEPLTLESRR